jgi:amidase/6-aminohexanoate-cyclic-dimer hydrolase
MGPRQFDGWNGLSSHHVITRSVRDSAALLDATAGEELGSPVFSPKAERPYLTETRLAPGRLRIALALDPPGDLPLDPECRSAALDAAALCETMGHIVDETTLPVDAERVHETLLTIIHVSVSRILGDAASELGRTITEHDVENLTWTMGQRGRGIDAVHYARAIGTMHQIGLEMADFQKQYDVILSPTLAKPPVLLGVLSLSQPDPGAFAKNVREFGPFTALYNVSGQPSMSVPLYWTPDGLPVGVMFSAPFGDEATLFRLAGQLEQARPWTHRRPTV